MYKLFQKRGGQVALRLPSPCMLRREFTFDLHKPSVEISEEQVQARLSAEALRALYEVGEIGKDLTAEALGAAFESPSNSPREFKKHRMMMNPFTTLS